MTTRGRTRQRGGQADRGAAAVEFALVFVLLLIILLGIIDFGRLFFVFQAVKSASREGARTSVIATTKWGASIASAPTATSYPPGTVMARVSDAGASAASLSGSGTGLTVTNSFVSAQSTVTPDTLTCGILGSQVEVTVSTPFTFLTPVGALGKFWTPDTLSSSTVMRCE